MTQGRRAQKNNIDVDAALELWTEHHNWAAVAWALPLKADGSHFTAMSVYLAVWRADRLPHDGRRRRATGAERDMNDRQLGVLWRPPMPRPLKVIPDYRTNTVARA